MLHYVGQHLTTLDAGQFVQVTVPVMHAQHTLARRVSRLHHCNASFNAAHALLLAKVISLLRLLNGQGKQLQTTTGRTPEIPAWQTLSPHHISGGVGGHRDQAVATLFHENIGHLVPCNQ